MKRPVRAYRVFRTRLSLFVGAMATVEARSECDLLTFVEKMSFWPSLGIYKDQTPRPDHEDISSERINQDLRKWDSSDLAVLRTEPQLRFGPHGECTINEVDVVPARKHYFPF